MIRLLATLLLSLTIITGLSAQGKYDIAPTDLKAIGVNKVLCLKNGNTMLFHFEPSKDIIIKVYDSLHKEIASRKQDARILDLYIIKEAVFKGLFEINNEAVLFVEQIHLSKYGLVRLRFNSTTGALIDEKLVGESKNVVKRTQFYTMKNQDEDSYAILFATDVPQFQDCNVYVSYYNSKHEITKEIPINIDRKNYDYLRVVNASIQPNGICISLSMAKLKQNGSGNILTDALGTVDVYNHQLYIYYIPKDSTSARFTSLDVTTDIFPHYANYTYNAFAETFNLMLLSYREVSYRNGVQWLPSALIKHIFFKIDEHDMALKYTWMENTLATKYLREKTAPKIYYEGVPTSMFTNENGLTSLVSSAYSRYLEPENNRRYNLYTYIRNISITQMDDDGNELWATVLPFSQRFKSHQRYYRPYAMANKAQTSVLFSDLPPQVYERQFIAYNSYKKGKDLFIVFNGDNNDINTISIDQHVDTVYNFNKSNACYYKLDSKKEVTKHFLFGTPLADEYKSSFIEGADFDNKRGIYATALQYRKDDNISVQMAWSYMD